jgi:hypothetical protein
MSDRLAAAACRLLDLPASQRDLEFPGRREVRFGSRRFDFPGTPNPKMRLGLGQDCWMASVNKRATGNNGTMSRYQEVGTEIKR